MTRGCRKIKLEEDLRIVGVVKVGKEKFYCCQDATEASNIEMHDQQAPSSELCLSVTAVAHRKKTNLAIAANEKLCLG